LLRDTQIDDAHQGPDVTNLREGVTQMLNDLKNPGTDETSDREDEKLREICEVDDELESKSQNPPLTQEYLDLEMLSFGYDFYSGDIPNIYERLEQLISDNVEFAKQNWAEELEKKNIPTRTASAMSRRGSAVNQFRSHASSTLTRPRQDSDGHQALTRAISASRHHVPLHLKSRTDRSSAPSPTVTDERQSKNDQLEETSLSRVEDGEGLTILEELFKNGEKLSGHSRYGNGNIAEDDLIKTRESFKKEERRLDMAEKQLAAEREELKIRVGIFERSVAETTMGLGG